MENPICTEKEEENSSSWQTGQNVNGVPHMLLHTHTHVGLYGINGKKHVILIKRNIIQLYTYYPECEILYSGWGNFEKEWKKNKKKQTIPALSSITKSSRHTQNVR